MILSREAGRQAGRNPFSAFCFAAALTIEVEIVRTNAFIFWEQILLYFENNYFYILRTNIFLYFENKLFFILRTDIFLFWEQCFFFRKKKILFYILRTISFIIWEQILLYLKKYSFVAAALKIEVGIMKTNAAQLLVFESWNHPYIYNYTRSFSGLKFLLTLSFGCSSRERLRDKLLMSSLMIVKKWNGAQM